LLRQTGLPESPYSERGRRTNRGTKHKRVLIALGWYDYRLHRGIEKYAQEHAWSLSANLAREKVVPWGWEGDGILAWLGAWDELAEFVERQNKPTVDFSFRRPHLHFPRVIEDHAHAAQLVADHFLSRGFNQFVFYSDAANWSYDERGRGFLEAVERAGHACLWLKWHESPAFRTDRDQWKQKRAWLGAELKKRPQPLALFAANDQHALDVLEACNYAHLVVPDQVAIVGAENYLLAPAAMRTPVSSVDTNLETLGYRGAALLDRLMSGKPAPKEPIRVPAAGLVARQSSDLLAVPHAGVGRSLRFIWEHGHEPISVKDLVGVAAMSRRSLHTAFLRYLGRTPGQELHRVRIERAKRLLGQRGQKIETIGKDCGYQRPNSFSVAFKQATGMSPKQYRDLLLP
jgi:LacI family transcriptional regulator